MSGPDGQSYGQVPSEQDVADALSQIRRHEERWDEYRWAMRDHTSRFEEAAAALGTNYFVQKDLAARREVDGYIGRLASEQSEVLTQTVRAINGAADTERSGDEGGGA
ncbi:hypothetical protein [Leifsonia sp. P73]|uniref:hypothetical protein n=1 Tax=Leifsonia sp. P73 TaxID=3423959 RepID=UPI003DA4B2A2